MGRLVYRESFRADLAAQLGYLVRSGEPTRIVVTLDDLGAAEELLERFPHAGREIARDGGTIVRVLRLRRAPFVVWYAVQMRRRRDAVVTMLRFFHERQRRTQPSSARSLRS